jgi:hypothetical protein
MLGCTLRSAAFGWVWLVCIDQLAVAQLDQVYQATSLQPTQDERERVEVTVSKLLVYDRANAASYLTGSLKPGDRVTVRERIGGGWLAIDPPSTAICWIDGSPLEFGSDAIRSGSHFGDPAGSKEAIPTQAWVATSVAILRSGHSSARLPGPPCGSLSKGTMVRFVGRPPIQVGRGKTSTTWYAIVPPAGIARYVRADGTRPASSQRDRPAERLAAYESTEDGPSNVEKLSTSSLQLGGRADPSSENLPPDIASEIAKVEAVHRSILCDQPIEKWRFDTVRARYQAILKRGSGGPSVEEAIRSRLERLTQHEQAAEAARTISAILARSHRRDNQVAAAERNRATPAPDRPRAFSAEGLVQPSSRMVEGRRLYSLIGTDGFTVAYLDVPPGLDIEPLMTRRIGVRGVSHYNEDLGARLITVRDVEPIETRR